MTSAELLLEAPIVAVTVYPHGARITRRGTVTVPSGDAHVVLDDLAFGLDPGTVRVTGRGSATVLGVDVVFRHHAESPESAVAALIVRKKEIIERSREISDAIEVQDARQRFLDELSSHAGASFAKQIAAGRAEYPTAFAETIATQHSAVRSEKRSLTAAAEGVQDELAAIEREIAARAEYRPDRRAVQIATAAAAAATIEFDVSYVVGGAGWTSVYDLRQTGERLNVTWYGVVSQQTGEDWPECDLALSTAQVSRSLTVPELAPWYLDRKRPPPPAGVARSAGAYGAAPAPMMALSADAVTGEFPVVKLETATVEQGLIAATYRPVRPVAVPADGESHRATVAVLDLASELDYVTAPVIAPEAYLRATATNWSEHTLQSGRASIFHDDEYVGTTMLAVWAPGEEVELALGVDDRVRIERELVRTSAGRGFTSNKREAGYKITIANHTARDARVTVRDQLPVSRDETIAIKDPRIDPRPTEVTDLGVVTWRTTLAPGSKGEFTMGFKVEVGKGIEIANWRD